jgi:arylsulfatase A-like enzyme
MRTIEETGGLTRRGMLRAAGGCLGASAVRLQAAQRKPNIVVIVSDDHGYGDVSCYDHGPEVRTPNIDRIAREGVRFLQGYASAYVCAPTRAGLMTGRYQQRFGFYTASDSRAGLPLSELTLADILKREGYATGAFGKWHLGLEAKYHPLRRGFDEFYGFLGHGGHDYFDLKPKPGSEYNAIWRNDKVIEDSGYLTENLARESVSFIQRHAAGPFFLYLAFNAVHFPLQAPPDTIRKYDSGNPKRDIYLAMLEHEDKAVGRVLDELNKQGAGRDTLVVFFSDNGGARNNASSNGALRDFKHSAYEGGIRVPFLMSWPGRIKQGIVSQEPVICLDVLPTVAAAAGAKLPAGREFHGVDLLPYLSGTAKGPAHEYLYWDCDAGRRAVRDGRWKLVDNDGRMELFNLETDLSEKFDVSSKNAEVTARLREALERWRKANAPRIRLPGGAMAEDEEEGGEKRKAKRKKKA